MKTKTILSIDDEPINLNALSAMLKRYNLITANSGAEALKIVEKSM
jgi:CheY-like chemotaxis protein